MNSKTNWINRINYKDIIIIYTLWFFTLIFNRFFDFASFMQVPALSGFFDLLFQFFLLLEVLFQIVSDLIQLSGFLQDLLILPGHFFALMDQMVNGLFPFPEKQYQQQDDQPCCYPISCQMKG